MNINHELAEIAQLGERQTEGLNVPGSIPGFGNIFIFFNLAFFFLFKFLRQLVGQGAKKAKTSGALLFQYFEKLFDSFRCKR